MQPTITQNSALYFVQHKISKRRSTPFRHLRAAGRNHYPDLGRPTFVDASFVRRLHRDDGAPRFAS